MVKVSIIMGIYNCADTLPKCIDSILEQTFEDWELLMCDDGSSDSTFKVAKEYEKRDPRIRVIKNPRNRGLAYSLNQLIKISQGKFVARLDGDDYCAPDRLEKQVEFLEKNRDYHIVGSNMTLFNEEGIWGERKMLEKPGKKAFLLSVPFAHPTIMVYKRCLERVGGYTVEKATLRCEDLDLYAKLYSVGYKGYNLQMPLYYFKEDHSAYKRRRYKYRFDEAKVRKRAFKKLGLWPFGCIYTLKPLIVGLVPQSILAKLRKENIQEA